MKKSLVKKITLSILAGAVLMSSSVVWAASVFVTQSEGGTDSFYLGFKESGSTAVTGDYNFAVGSGAKIDTATKSVAIGTNSEIKNASGSVALGYGSVASASNVVSVGDGGAVDGNNQSYGPDTRSIINVTDIATAADIADGTKISEISSTYGSYVVNLNTLQKALSEISSNSSSADVYTKTETNNAITSAVSGKADKATTLAGYDITDAYTKDEVNSNFATQQALTNGLDSKADKDSVYTKDETDNRLSTKANKSTTLSGYGITDAYTKDEVNSNFVTQQALTNSLDSKADKDSVYTKDETDNKLGIKADKSTTLSGYGITDAYTKAEVDGMLSGSSAAISGINQRLEKTNAKINKVGAGAAALAALHPLDYDPDDKLTFSAGMGNYAGENAAALGAFYRPNEKFMLSLGGTMGNGENMVNLGLSIGLDKPNGFAKLSKRELIQKVNVMEAKYEQVEAENDAMKAEIAEMKAMLQELLAKNKLK